LILALESKKAVTGPPRRGAKKHVNGSFLVTRNGETVIVTHQSDDAVVQDLKNIHCAAVSAGLLRFQSRQPEDFYAL